MEIVKVLIYSIIQGITEFVPVSSSGHLVILHELLPLSITNELAFDVALHFGTTVALIAYFFSDIRASISRGISSASRNSITKWILFALPVLISGFFLESFIDSQLHQTLVVIVMLLIGSVLFFIAERAQQGSKELASLTPKDSLIVGVAQAFSLIPGLSRSGVTIATLMLLGYKRQESARISFIYVIPLLLIISCKKGFDLIQSGVSPDDTQLIVLGILGSCIAGLLALRILMPLLQKITLKGFAYYRIVIAALLLLFL